MLVGIAFALAVACMAALSAQAVVNRAACSGGYTRVGVAVSDDIAPAIKTIAASFNKTRTRAGGRCVQVHVTAQDPSVTAGEIDGQPAGSARKANVHLPSDIDAWIPDSSLWVDVVRGTPQGAMTVRATVTSVAKSPLVIVTTQAVASARAMQAFAGPVSWGVLLPPGFGGPPSYLGLTVDLPDPAISAVGMATTIEVTRQISSDFNARSVFTDFVYDSATTQNTDSVQALANFVSSSASLQSRAVTVASEQAVLAYDKSHPDTPLVARYPTGMTSSLGSPELDYPYVLTTSASQEHQAAADFGKFLQSGYAQSTVRYYGFRSADGVPDAMPASAGLASEPLQVASPITPADEAKTLAVWTKVSFALRAIFLSDVSAAMTAPSGIAGLDLEQEATGMAPAMKLFPASTQLGFWLIGGATSTTKQPAQQLVPIGGLTADYGLTSRAVQVLAAIARLSLFPHGNLLLYDAIWKAYQVMTQSYSPNDSNFIVVFTAGVDGKGDMSPAELLTKLKAAFDPSKPVRIVIVEFGNKGNSKALARIAAATGEKAYQVLRPSQGKRIFGEAVSQLLCSKGCTKP